MTYHGVLIPNQIAALNVDSLNRHASASAIDIDNGNVFALLSKSTVAGESEVWVPSTPTTGSLANLWMAYASDEIVVTNAKYKGIDPDPRNFFNAAGDVFSAFKPMLYDIITLTGDALDGTYIANTTTHVNATNGTMKLTWGNSQTADVTSFKLLAVTYISLATGAIDDQRETAYQFECVHA